MRCTAAAIAALTLTGGISLLATAAPPAASPNTPRLTSSTSPIRFARDIQPILSDKCYRCHGPDPEARSAGLRLDTPEGLRQAFVPGKPEKSPAFLRISHPSPGLRMPPPSSHLTVSPGQIALIRKWIVQGAPWEQHWAFVKPTRPPLPKVKNANWGRNAIDAFVLSRLEKAGMTPSPEAPKETLIRRVTFDLTGLPPTPAEVDAFLADRSPNAYEKVVDKLLADPRYGERMTWEWLDVARYADTNGFQQDGTRTMWPWRDWVLGSFNDNLPYDRFLTEQIAGDLLPNATTDQIIATGFHRNHMLNGEGGRIAEESRAEYVMDRVETFGTAFLGLTISCARCHDHKYDPLTQKDYYSLAAYFNSIDESGAVDAFPNANPVLALPTPEQSAKVAALKKPFEEWEAKLRATPENAPERAEIQKQRDETKKRLDAANAEILKVMVLRERAMPRETHIYIRGAYDKPGAKVTHGTPAVLPGLPKDAPANRLALARWLISPENPLTARVAVNRHWQMLFGIGLVKTTEDFGLQGERPVHAELLDWLATEYIRLKWDTKALLRLIVTSATYRQSSRMTPAARERDPENRLLARGPRFRLPSPMLRDQALAVSGLLVEKAGGPPVKPYQPEGVWEDFSYGKITYQQDHGEALYRRSLYTFWRRSVAPTEFFDTAARRVCTVRVERTNTPLHALTLLNDTTFVEAARVLAERMLTDAATFGKTPEERITAAFRRVTCRRPTAAEAAILAQSYRRAYGLYAGDRAAALKLLSVGEKPRNPGLDVTEHAAYTQVASLVLNLDEALTKE
jgi:hypothetical protein